MRKYHWLQSCQLALHLACFSTLTMAQTPADPKQSTSAQIPAPESSKPSVSEKASKPAESNDISLERQAYRIEIRFSVAENVALDSSTANQCLIDLKSLLASLGNCRHAGLKGKHGTPILTFGSNGRSRSNMTGKRDSHSIKSG